MHDKNTGRKKKNGGGERDQSKLPSKSRRAKASKEPSNPKGS